MGNVTHREKNNFTFRMRDCDLYNNFVKDIAIFNFAFFSIICNA